MKTLKKLFIPSTLIGLFIYFYAPKFVVQIDEPIMNSLTKSHDFGSFTATSKIIKLRGFDNTELEAAVTYSLPKSRGTIILLHGIRASKERFIDMSNRLAFAGYDVVALDLRAHGNSGGKYCTFGVKEKNDVKALIDQIYLDKKLNKNIGVWGQSLGGAVALQAMANDRRISFGVVESTFSNFRQTAHEYTKLFMKINIPPLTNFLVSQGGKIADFNPADARTSEVCKLVTQPILLVHGKEDKRIPIQHGKTNFINLASNQKEFIEIDGAKHIDVWDVGGDDYINTVFNFFKDQTKNE